MAIAVIVKIDQVYFTAAADQYGVNLTIHASDGTAAQERSTSCTIPISWTQRRADRFIRETIAAEVSSNFSLIIDPEDIYIPLSS